MSLAEELLADFSPEPSPSPSPSDLPEGEHDGLKANSGEGEDVGSVDDSSSGDLVLKELESTARVISELQPLLGKIEGFLMNPSEVAGNIEESPEYRLLVEGNSLAVEINTEISTVYKLIKEIYFPRFPEIESLVLNPVDYTKAVKIIGNDVSDIPSKSNDLAEFLQPATIMVITVSASTTRVGRALSKIELEKLEKACEILLFLEESKKKITTYVSTKLSVFAPNIAALVGSQTAAQLFSVAGGLTGLSKLPSCNIPSLGSKSQVNIAARVDRVHQYMGGEMGQKLKQEVLEKLEKLAEPPTNKGPKSLPVPDDKPSKKRGGKRIRKYKEQFAMTEMRKAQNRMRFGEQEEEVTAFDESIGLGMLSKSEIKGMGLDSSLGKVRAYGIDNATKPKLSKNLQQRLEGLNAASSRISGLSSSSGNNRLGALRSEVNGLSSSLSFTPVQGIELVDPASMRKKAHDDKWFKGGTFSMVGTGNIKKSGEMSLNAPVKRKFDDLNLPGPDSKR
ncbi:Prp31p [Dipodascopsis tothii]|uniref:Prp31p n=1 Tax=Dipodascopsis tothii TaxID=44089 RepID=UPI0034CE3BD1